MNTGFKTTACLAATVLLGVTASAQEIIYDNTSDFLGLRTDEGNAEIGDQVIFAGSARTLTLFQFEYFVTPVRSGNEMAQVFIRAMDGPNAGPGTVLFSSTPRTLQPGPNGYGSVSFEIDNVIVPSSVTWSVLFSGLDGAEEGGLLFYNPPGIGSSPTFDNGSGAVHFMYRNDGALGWNLVDYTGVVDNLGARFTAVPEPSTWALILGGLAGFGILRRRKS